MRSVIGSTVQYLSATWLTRPTSVVPGTTMAFAGLPKDQDRANLIAYLNSMSDAPAKLGK